MILHETDEDVARNVVKDLKRVAGDRRAILFHIREHLTRGLICYLPSPAIFPPAADIFCIKMDVTVNMNNTYALKSNILLLMRGEEEVDG